MRRAAGTSVADTAAAGIWVDGIDRPSPDPGSRTVRQPGQAPPRPPQTRAAGHPRPEIATDGLAVLRYPFQLRGNGNRVRLRGAVEIMTTDGAQVEPEAPRGRPTPIISAWIAPDGTEHRVAELEVEADETDGVWSVEVPILDEAMMRVDISPEIA